MFHLHFSIVMYLFLTKCTTIHAILFVIYMFLHSFVHNCNKSPSTFPIL